MKVKLTKFTTKLIKISDEIDVTSFSAEKFGRSFRFILFIRKILNSHLVCMKSYERHSGFFSDTNRKPQ